jgi:nitrate reductase gamma subunit
MTIALTVLAYIVAAVFYLRIIWRFILLSRLKGEVVQGASVLSIYNTVLDVVFLRRLLKANPLLWIGEWVFHVSFIIIFMGHLRYLLNPAPEFVILLSVTVKLVSITLPASLIYILIFRLINKIRARDYYMSRYNLMLVVTILLASASGIALRFLYRTDLVKVKEYILGGLSFNPVGFPDSAMFAAHFILALIVISVIPTHIFTAPFISMDVSSREEGISSMMHSNEK